MPPRKKSAAIAAPTLTPAALARLELAACTATTPDPAGLNPNVVLPYGVIGPQVLTAMTEFTDFLTFVNTQLSTRGTPRLETMLMPANFSSMVGEFMSSNLPKACASIVKNKYHNGHPDMLPAGMYPGDSLQHGTEGIEVKASRYLKGWQGHNAEDCWLMVCVYESGRPTDEAKGILPKPFRYLEVLCARLEKADWNENGRREGSRRTITASVTPDGYAKMFDNWIYRAPGADAAIAAAEAGED